MNFEQDFDQISHDFGGLSGQTLKDECLTFEQMESFSIFVLIELKFVFKLLENVWHKV